MIKDEIVIPINEETMTFMEALHYEVNSYIFIMKTVLTENEISKQDGYHYNEDTYRIFMDEYKEAFRRYELAKKEILHDYVPEEYKHLVFNFNFEKNVLESSKEVSCHGCNH